MNQKSWSYLIAAVLIIAGAFFLFNGSGDGTGTLVLKITDAPAELNISKAVVTISKVQVHMAGSGSNESGDNQTAENESASAESGWFTVVEGPVEYDLVAIKDVKEVLGSKELEAGRYTQVRLSVDSALVTIDGKESNLEIPSSSVKLIRGFTIEANKTTTLTLDFDAQESIKLTGSDKYIMRPTIKIIQE